MNQNGKHKPTIPLAMQTPAGEITFIRCGSCRFWDKQPPNPTNLAAPRVGLCRAVPPAFMLLPTPQGMAPAFGYPTLQEDMLPCSFHQLPQVSTENA